MKRTPFLTKMPTEPKVRTRKCAVKSCRAIFQPRNMMHKCCSPDCAEAYAKAERERKEKMDRQQGLLKLKKEKRSYWIAETQKVFNAWIHWRDRDKPCICCGKTEVSNTGHGGGWDAGHYLSRGSHPHLRFDERNVFRQRKGCNRPGGTTATAFRLGVIKRIGLAAVEALESDQAYRKWTIPELQAIKEEYSTRLKEAKKQAKEI